MNQCEFDLVLRRCNLASMRAGTDYGLVADAALCVSQGRIVWMGADQDLPSSSCGKEVDLAGRWITPGLIDCHTHLVFGGNRAAEFEMRLGGASYQQIAAAGGGIASTVAATSAASEDELVDTALPRLLSLLRDGVTTVEIKSGYGLDLAGERKMLRAARRLSGRAAVRVTTTYLGLHALPTAYARRPDDYVDLVVRTILPALAEEGLADAVDAYVEPLAFSPAQAERFLAAARKLGLQAKLHAEQLSKSGGAALAARARALSADHLEYVEDGAVAAMAEAGVAAVILPGAYLCLREDRPPPIELFRKHRVPMAVATDCNPGTSPLTSILLAMNLACTLFRLTPAEALQGTTRNAAKALGLERSCGTIEVGKVADLAIWDISHPSELSYWMGHSPLHARCLDGSLRLISKDTRSADGEGVFEFEPGAGMG